MRWKCIRCLGGDHGECPDAKVGGFSIKPAISLRLKKFTEAEKALARRDAAPPDLVARKIGSIEQPVLAKKAMTFALIGGTFMWHT